MGGGTDQREAAASAGNPSPRPRPATPLTGPRPRAVAPPAEPSSDEGSAPSNPPRPPQSNAEEPEEAPPEEAPSEEAPSEEAEPEGRARRAMRWLLASKADPDAEAADESEPEAPRARPTPRPAPAEVPSPEQATEPAESDPPIRPRPGGEPSNEPVVLTKDERPPSPRPSPRAPEAAETSDQPEPAAAYDASDPEADARMARFTAATEAGANGTATRHPTGEDTVSRDWITSADRDEPDVDKPSLVSRLLHPRKNAGAETATAAEADTDAKDGAAKDGAAKDGEAKDGDAEKSEKSGSSGRSRKRLIRSAIFVVIIVAVALLVRTYVAAPYYIPSASMEPTLHGCMNCNDDHVIVDKFSYRLHEPEQTDIVVFERPPNLVTNESVLIKRVVAVPGDTIALRGGKVIVNGKALNESYLNQTYLARQCRERGQTAGTYNTFNSRSQWKIPKGEVFVMGDNRCDSMDSRAFGPIKESSVIGRAIAIIWPLKRLRTL